MKLLFLIAMVGLSSVSVYGISWGVEKSFAKFIANAGGNLSLKYPIMSWENLQFRRDEIDKAIAVIQNTTGNDFRSAYLAEQGVSSDVKPLLYQIMEHTVAIHSGLPRIGPTIESIDDYRNISDISPSELEMFERSFVPHKTWEVYIAWGTDVREELERSLESVPESMLTGKYGENYRRKFFEIFDNEFSQTSTREVYALGGGFNDAPSTNFDYMLKNDLPEFVAHGETKDYYKPRFPHGFLADFAK